MPVTFSILTNIAAFMPMFFVPGVMGKIFRVIPAVVVTVFLLSLVESLFILPAHLAHAREAPERGFRGRVHRRQQRFSYWFSNMIQTRYGPLLDRVVRRRYLVFAFSLSILIVTVGFIRSGRMGMSMFPRVEADYAFATATLPYGSSVERTEAIQARLIQAAEAVAAEQGNGELVQGILARIGSSGTDGPFDGNVATGGSRGHLTEVGILLTDPESRPLTTAEVTKAWRRKVGTLPGLKSLIFESNRGGPGAGAALTVQLSHKDLDVLERAATDLAETLGGFPIVKDIDSGFSPGKQQIDFRIKPEGQSLGLTAAEVARQVRNAYYGAEVVRQQRGRNEMKIMVRLPEDERISEYNLEKFIVRTPAGTDVPLREVVELQRGRAFTSINRSEGRRVITVTADVDPPTHAPWIQQSIDEEILPDLIARFPGLRLIYEGQQADMAESLVGLAIGFMLAMLVLYALLAVPFKSYVQPLIVMISIPFGLVGAVLGHLLMGFSLSVMSMFGVVALSGVVINDSLILIDYANRQRRSGATPHDAILAAGVRRFRPIMLTTMTTFGGLAPMIFEKSMQARFLIPMAISLGYGIVFATLITLGLVPSLYLIVEDVRAFAARWKRSMFPAQVKVTPPLDGEAP
jgi:multidrug efflux pump subunit AcrB